MALGGRTRIEKLKSLEKDLENLMSKANSRTYASLAKQYRETIKEIAEIEGEGNCEDEISKIISGANGVPGAVRTNRSKVQTE